MTQILFAPDLTFEQYARCFAIYRRRSGEVPVMKSWAEREAARLAVGRRAFAVLSVGCGTGELDVEVLRTLTHCTQWLHYVGVEPNDVHRGALETRLTSLHSTAMSFELIPEPFESFKSERRFDLIIFSHSLYYIARPAEAVARARSLLAPGGELVIFHQTPHGIGQVQERFLKRIKGRDDEMLSSRDLALSMREQQLCFEYQELPNYLDITECFDESSENGKELINFFLESDVSALPPEPRAEIRDFLDTAAATIGGQRLLSQPVGVFQIYEAAE